MEDDFEVKGKLETVFILLVLMVITTLFFVCIKPYAERKDAVRVCEDDGGLKQYGWHAFKFIVICNDDVPVCFPMFDVCVYYIGDGSNVTFFPNLTITKETKITINGWSPSE